MIFYAAEHCFFVLFNEVIISIVDLTWREATSTDSFVRPYVSKSPYDSYASWLDPSYHFLSKSIYQKGLSITSLFADKLYTSGNFRKIGVRVTVYRQLRIPVLVFSLAAGISASDLRVFFTLKLAVKCSRRTWQSFSTTTSSLLFLNNGYWNPIFEVKNSRDDLFYRCNRDSPS